MDLASDPIANHIDPFDLLHLYIPGVALDAMADDAGVRRIDDLNLRFDTAYDDPVVRHLALALLPALDRPHEANQLFVDCVARSMHHRLARTYGGLRSARLAAASLTKRQLRRATELLNANIDGEIELSVVAAACNLSLSQFARSFKRSTGKPPHRWLLARRVDLAQSLLLDTDQPL